ncbi:MAG: nucleotidyl transferase AbiEii/AbiGii toxin family protein [Tannerellaceae bacterium]|jgi:predicted nucleotidyltransferase component of viral defense system|nr:nucleotidyl transferase AbiEii/AbiGii toxin family protein [Tannerellaceae bacterium]
MNNPVFESMLSHYEVATKEERQNATHEVMQQIALAGLYRSGFFNRAAFYGGACLRFFHGSPQFSEDLDFSLLQADEYFCLENYFDAITTEFRAFGLDITIARKEKKTQTLAEPALGKDTTEIYILQFTTERNVKIKIKVDTQPPAGFTAEYKLLMLPFSFMVRCYALSDSYARQMHAFLFRECENRVKGRDWYDFEWYVRNNIALNFEYLQQKMEQLNAIAPHDFSVEHFKSRLKERILNTNMNAMKNDVCPFLKNPAEIDIWSCDYFLQLVDRIILNG